MLVGKLLKSKPRKAYEKILSKSNYLNGLQCPKLIWVSINDKQRFPAIDEAQQHIFDEGHVVGEYAKKLFPNGIDIEDKDFKRNLELTQEYLKNKKPLFEAAFSPEGERIYSRADILDPQKDGSWNIIEVKSSTQVKDVNISDVAFQKYVYEKSGLRINKCFLLHINNKYVRHGKLEIDKLFTKEDITEKVEEEIKLVPGRIKEMLAIIDGEEPKIQIGSQCNAPYECGLKELCWGFLPEHSVFDLYYGGKKAQKLLDEGILAIKDIPESFELGDKHKIQQWCVRNNKPHVNKKGLENFIKKLKFPLYFLDFETFQTTIPIFDNQRAYQQIPFQFSLHIIEKKGQEPKHFEFLAEGKDDPRKAFLEALIKVIGKKGSIITYNQSFEQGRMEELAEVFKKDAKAVALIIKRMVDLLVPFRNFDYYDCKQQGSCSIKYVLPALTGKSYEGMDIANGGQASLSYFYSIHGLNGKSASESEVKKIRADLLKYCGLDTMAMIDVLKVLREKADIVYSSNMKAGIKSYEKFSLPEDEEEKNKFIALVKKKGLWDDLSMINHFKISSLAAKGDLDKDLQKKLVEEEAYRVSLSKRKETGEEY